MSTRMDAERVEDNEALAVVLRRVQVEEFRVPLTNRNH